MSRAATGPATVVDSWPPASWSRRFLRGWPSFLLLASGVTLALLLVSAYWPGAGLVALGLLVLLAVGLPAAGLVLWEVRPGRRSDEPGVEPVGTARSADGPVRGIGFFYSRRRVLAGLCFLGTILVSFVWALCVVVFVEGPPGREVIWSAVYAVLLVVVLAMLAFRSARRLRNPHSVVLTARGVELADGPTSLFTPWDNLRMLAASHASGMPRLDFFMHDRSRIERLRADPSAPGAVRSSRHRGLRRRNLALSLMSGHPDYLFYAVHFYWRHPEARHELESGDAVHRLRASRRPG